MAGIPELWNEVAREVEDLITQNPYAVERFKEQIRVFNQHWRSFWEGNKDEPLPAGKMFHPKECDCQYCRNGEPLPYYDPPVGNAKDQYEYEHDLKSWFLKDVEEMPPNPAFWELEDKLPCYYTTLAVIYDSVKGKIARSLCDGILDDAAFKFTKIYAENSDVDTLNTAIKWVKRDLAKGTETNAAARGDKAGEPQRKRTRKQRGRKPVGKQEDEKRRKILGEWEEARSAGVSRTAFCDDKGITIGYLERCQAWNRQRDARSN